MQTFPLLTGSPAAPRDAALCLAGGGEMGALMRSIDWSGTALGPLEGWPQSLRTTVSTCLNSRFPILIWWGPELVMLYNDAYRQILGAKHPRAMGQRGRECWPEIWHIIGPMLHGVLERGQATWSENQLLELVRNGFPEECYFTFSYSPIRDESGDMGGVFCAVTETTRQVLDERRLKTLRSLAARTANVGSAEEACLRAVDALAENPQDLPFALLYLVDVDRRTAHLAAAAGRREAPPAVDLAPEAGEGAWPFREVMRTGEGVQAGPQVLALPVGPPASPSAFLVAGLSPRLALDDGYRGFLRLAKSQIGTAIASARAFEEAKRRAEALAEIDRAKTMFFSNVSHEFRTPLTLMIGPLEDALADPSRSLSGAALESAWRNAQRLLKLVNALLDFSRIEAGRVRASFDPVDLAAATAELAGVFRSAIERGGLKLIVRCEDPREPVYVDRDMWEKIVLNLLSNAFKFTFEGEIEVSLARAGRNVELKVRDTGIGIAAQDLPRVFERFHRIEGARARTYEGSGIGLALVHELVRIHGGDIRVESEPGRGTTFTVSLQLGREHLPKDRVGAKRELAPTATRAAAYAAEALGWLRETDTELLGADVEADGPDTGMRVLVADDNADMRDYLVRLLCRRWRVEAVADGVAALAAMEHGEFDLVLTDVMMPRLDGLGLLRAIKTHAATRAIPVIMLSARAGEDYRIEGLEAGADDYLYKPFSGRELVARVKSQLALLIARRERERERALLLGREQDARREAELQKEYLATVFMQAPNPIAMLRGPDHVVELANAPACRVWRRRAEDIVGKPLLEAMPELRGQAFESLLDGVLRTGVPHEGKEVAAKIASPDDGSVKTVFFNFVYAPLRGVRGDIEGVLAVAFDVTDEVNAREQMSRLRADAEAASRAKDEFLAMLGHELRNPLSPITTALQIVRLRGTTSRELDIIERQVGHLTGLIDDLLDVSRITSGKIELRRQPLEIADVVARAIETASPILEQRKHRVDVDVARGLVVDGDPGRLAQVVSNLLTNAAKYSEPRSGIAIAAHRHGDSACIRVKDHGIGIAPEMIDRVFDLFVQQPQTLARSEGGLGLGLAIVRNLVQMHGGTVEARSEGLGKGSEFVVDLPLARAGAAPAAQPPAPLARRMDRTAARRILVVDDNVDAAESLKELLQQTGHTVEVAHDGPAALAAAKAFHPEIALVDIGLPVMDGYEVAERLRSSYGPDLELIAITGYGQDADRKRSLQAGFRGHLVKPLDFPLLEQILVRTAARLS